MRFASERKIFTIANKTYLTDFKGWLINIVILFHPFSYSVVDVGITLNIYG
jgi:hypothetical protein